jgi:putative oxidoreductase
MRLRRAEDELGRDMKVVTTVSRILLGIIFAFFGGNGVHHYPFMPMTVPPGAAGQLMIGLLASHFVILIGLCQLIGGLIMLIGRYVTLGLVILGPEIVCILFFHIVVWHTGWPMAALVTLLWVLVALAHKHHLAGIFAARA